MSKPQFYSFFILFFIFFVKKLAIALMMYYLCSADTTTEYYFGKNKQMFRPGSPGRNFFVYTYKKSHASTFL